MENSLVIACQSCGYLIRDMIRAYVAEGYMVTLLTSKGSWNSMKDELPEVVKFRPVITYDRTSTLKRLFTWTICAVQMYFKIVFLRHKKEILYVSNPPFAPLLPIVLCNKFSILIWDVYPDVLVSQGVFGKDAAIVKWWSNINKKVFVKARKVFTISNGMKECLVKYVEEERIKVIPLWPDNSNLHRVDKSQNQFIKDNQLEGKFIVMYSGNLGNTHRMDVLVDVAKNIQDKDVIFVIIGEGGKKKIIEQRISDECVDNILMLPYQPYDFLSHSLSAADIAVITLDTQSSAMSVPSKTFNMMSLGVPLMCIASPKSELGNIVRKYNVGDIFEPENVNSMIEFVLKLKTNDSVKKLFAENSLNASLDFSPENAKMFIE